MLLIGAVMTIFLVYGAISWIDTYLQNIISVEYIEMRMGGHFYSVLEKILEISLEQSESSEIRQMMERSLIALSGNDSNGVQGMMQRFWNVFYKCTRAGHICNDRGKYGYTHLAAPCRSVTDHCRKRPKFL